MRYLVSVILVSFLVIVILSLDHFGRESIGLLQILLVNYGVALVLFFLHSSKPIRFRYILTVLIMANLGLFFNGHFSASSMSSSGHMIPYLQNATDVLYMMLMFSAFLLFIPMIIYGIFIFSLAKLIVIDKQEYFNDETENLVFFDKKKISNAEQYLFWMEKSFEKGDVSCAKSIAGYYYTLNEKNLEKSIEWLMKAADMQDLGAIKNLAYIYAQDLKDKSKAIHWYNLAYELGYEEAKVKIKALNE